MDDDNFNSELLTGRSPIDTSHGNAANLKETLIQLSLLQHLNIISQHRNYLCNYHQKNRNDMVTECKYCQKD